MRGLLMIMFCLVTGCATEAKLKESIQAVASDISSGVKKVLGGEKNNTEKVEPVNEIHKSQMLQKKYSEN